jgi:1-deoxy-D-xylulose 5-phosphate reductoisomerase
MDSTAFPAVALAAEVGQAGGIAPAAYNAANEQAVEAFLRGRISFPAILDTVAAVVSERPGGDGSGNALTVEDVLSAETWARHRADALIEDAAR